MLPSEGVHWHAPQNVLLRYIDCFKLKALEKQQIQWEAFSELPLSTWRQILQKEGVYCPSHSSLIPVVERILSHLERPGLHSSSTWLWIVGDGGLVLSGGVCRWSHSWTCSGGHRVCGGPGWHQVGTAGCRDTCTTHAESSKQCVQDTQPHLDSSKPEEMLLV